MKLFIKIKQFFIVNYLRLFKNREQKIYTGENACFDLIKEMKKKKFTNIFVLSDKNITKINLIGNFLISLKNNNFNYVLFDEVESDPCIETVEKALNFYK